MIRSHTIKRNSRQRAGVEYTSTAEQKEIDGLLYQIEQDHIFSAKFGFFILLYAVLVNDPSPFTCVWYGMGANYTEAFGELTKHIEGAS